MATAELARRGIVRVTGEEARGFLDRLVTCDLDRVGPGRARFGALLSPQGKILADFILAEAGGQDFLLDCPAPCIGDLVRRLGLYKLRAKVAISDVSGTHAVRVGWNATPPPDEGLVVPDPRLPELGWRAVVKRKEGTGAEDEGAYHAHRVRLGVPEAGQDFALGDAFPHEALMDQLGGIDFDKGCYVGQEVVSRMQHRGTARTRIVSLAYADASAPEPGAEVTGGQRSLGGTGSAAGDRGLAMIRLDRAADALTAGDPILAGGRAARFVKPDWVRFPYPGEAPAPAA